MDSLMNMTGSRWITGVVGIVSVTGLICALGLVIVGPPAVEAKQVVQPTQTSPYEMEIKPLTTVECGQCHFSVFQTIKYKGTNHQIDCVQCHREYHVYNPRKQNYDEIMPKCAWCHVSGTGGAFHGENKTLTPCLNCHADPHKPLTIPLAEVDS